MVNNSWKECCLTDLCSVQIGLTHTPKYILHGVPFLSVKDLNNGELSFKDAKYISHEEFLTISDAAKPKNGDIVFGRVGTLGNPCIVNTKNDFAIFVSLGYFRTKEGVLSEFIYHWLKSDLFYRLVEEKIAGSSQKNLNTGWLKEFFVVLPPYNEQKCIAAALSDVDGMISSLEKLIAKKKAIKQGAMQELLTGKKRLPSFNGEWSKINLAKKSKIKARIGWQGLTTNEYLDSGYSYLVTGTDFVNGKIDWDNCHYVAKDRFDQDKNIQIQNDDILITKDGSLGKTALVKGLDQPATLNSGVFVIRPIQESYDPAFVYYILSSFVFKDFLDHLSAGSTIIHLYQKDISKFEFLMPPTIGEQVAIASILSDMDKEIESLEQKLAKTRQIKQGMMQQLLTGKIRLV